MGYIRMTGLLRWKVRCWGIINAARVGTKTCPPYLAAFGAFVDIGVYQDGLVHISALSNSFVRDPHAIVKAGQVVKVKVLEVDEKRKPIALTMRLTDAAPQSNGKPEQRNTQRQQDSLSHIKSAVGDKQREPPRTAPNAMAAAFSKIKT